MQWAHNVSSTKEPSSRGEHNRTQRFTPAHNAYVHNPIKRAHIINTYTEPHTEVKGNKGYTRTKTYTCTLSYTDYPSSVPAVVSTVFPPAPFPLPYESRSRSSTWGWPENGDNKGRGQATTPWKLFSPQSLIRSCQQAQQLRQEWKSSTIVFLSHNTCG